MELARVVGSVWATVKQPALGGGRFVLLQPLDASGAPKGAVVAATDTVGAGPGDRVLWTTAYEAAIPWKRLHPVDLAATDASVVAILDRFGPRGEAR